MLYYCNIFIVLKKIVFDKFKVYSNINWLLLRIGEIIVIVVYDSDVIGIVDYRCIKCYVEIVSVVLKLIFLLDKI